MHLQPGVQFEDTRVPVSELLERTINTLQDEYITLRGLITLLGEQGLLLICVLLSLPFLFPVSIPGVSTVFGAGIVLVALAITANCLPWLPGFIADRKLDSEKLIPVLQRGVTFMRKLDRYLKPRWLHLTRSALINRFNGMVLMLSGMLLMVPLSFVPLSNTLPGLAILLLASGISQRDGILVASGYALVVATMAYFGGLAYLFYVTGKTIAF